MPEDDEVVEFEEEEAADDILDEIDSLIDDDDDGDEQEPQPGEGADDEEEGANEQEDAASSSDPSEPDVKALIEEDKQKMKSGIDDTDQSVKAVRRRRTHDWSSYKMQWILSDSPSLTAFFEKLAIPPGTWYRHTSGWAEEREKHRLKMDRKVLERFKGSELVSVERQKETLGDILTGVVMQWHRINSRLAQVEEALMKRKPSAALLRELRLAFQQTTRLLPDLIKTQDLLAGHASKQDQVHDRALQQISKLAENADMKLDKFEEVHGMSLKIEMTKKTSGQNEEEKDDEPIEADFTVKDKSKANQKSA